MSNEIERIIKAALMLPTGDQQRLLAQLSVALNLTAIDLVGEGNPDYIRATSEQALRPALPTDDTARKPMENLERITQQPGLMGGKACIRGMRVTVGMIIGQLASGAGIDDLLADYPYLEREDIVQALRYAAWRAEEREITLKSA